MEPTIDDQWISEFFEKYQDKLTPADIFDNQIACLNRPEDYFLGDDSEAVFMPPDEEPFNTEWKLTCCMEICEKLYNEGIMDFYHLKHHLYALRNYAKSNVTQWLQS